ncbi:MAG: transporter [Nitrosomonadaceae bacterium]|nr:transporter [Nitrosomonadaceae bacterium]
MAIQKLNNLIDIKLVIYWLVLTACFLFTPIVSAQDFDTNTAPAKTISNLHIHLLEGMKGGNKLGFQGRFKLLAPIIENSHELDFILKKILGGLWAKLEPEQKKILSDHFHKLSISTYAGWFKKYDNEHFEYIEQKKMPRDYVLVRSQLVRSSGDTVSLDYLLRKDETGWRIINVLADGVSDLALKRVEYRTVLEQKGFNVFIDMLKKKIKIAEEN